MYMMVEPVEENGADGVARSYRAFAMYLKDGPGRSVFVVNVENSFFSMVGDLVSSRKGEVPESVLVEALRVGLEYLWREDSGCECLCVERRIETDYDA